MQPMISALFSAPLVRRLSSAALPNKIPIITKPEYLKNVEKRVLQKVHAKDSHRREEAARLSRLRQNPIMIHCHDAALNHYKGQTYPSFSKLTLASAGWHHGKSVGDFFTIKRFSDENPSIESKQDVLFSGSWTETGLLPALIEGVEKLGFNRPTKIQAIAVPELITGNNCLISAETGSGKTLAFVLPVLQTILLAKGQELMKEFSPRVNKPFAMIVTPGRELAIQISDVVRSLIAILPEELGIKMHLVLGGSFERKLDSVPAEEVDLVIGTVGMLGKFFSQRVYNTSEVRFVVFDEIDALVDKSFGFRTRKIMENFFTERASGIVTNVCMAGATIPEDIDEICDGLIQISQVRRIETPLIHRVMPHVEQKFIRVSKGDRAERLLELIRNDVQKGDPVIIFSNKAESADWVSLFLNENGVKAVNYNAEMRRDLRDKQFGLFRTGVVSVLSATDLGSRGLDTSVVKHVVNFDFPRSLSDYIHRCGRVGRVGGAEHCRVTSFVWKKTTLDIVRHIETSVRKGIPLSVREKKS